MVILANCDNFELGKYDTLSNIHFQPDPADLFHIAHIYFCSWASAQVHYYQNLVSEFRTKSDVISFIKLIDG